MSFHPKMAYGATFHKSSRQLEDEGPPFVYTAERRARFDEIVTRYPPDRRSHRTIGWTRGADSQQGVDDEIGRLALLRIGGGSEPVTHRFENSGGHQAVAGGFEFVLAGHLPDL